MPRASADAKSAAAFRVQPTGKYPQAPAHLTEDAKVIWDEIVKDRPRDYFKPGSLHLLEQFVRFTLIQRQFLDLLELDPTDDDAFAKSTKLGANLTTLATKLRLSIQSEKGRHGIEGEGKTADEKAVSLDRKGLLGGYTMIETRIK